MPKILLTRHGHVEGISPERFRGQAELALTEKGLAQAAALAERISREWHPVAIYSHSRVLRINDTGHLANIYRS